jgi:hypothetical protein
MSMAQRYAGYLEREAYKAATPVKADADNFRRALAARIAEKWRGGIKARRIVRHNAEVRGDAPLYGAASLSTDGFGGADNGERK